MSLRSDTSALLLDTHVWVKYIRAGDLKTATVSIIEQARERGEVFVSVISVWEIAMLVRKGSLVLPLGPLEWAQRALQLPGTRLLPLTPEIVVRSVELPRALNKDPADRFLVASAQLENLRLMTRDKNIRLFAKAFKVPLVTA